MYLKEGKLRVETFGRGYAWFDCGTMDSLLEASTFVQMVEKVQGIKVSVPEEIACRLNWITREQVRLIADSYGASAYAEHLHDFLEKKFL